MPHLRLHIQWRTELRGALSSCGVVLERALGRSLNSLTAVHPGAGGRARAGGRGQDCGRHTEKKPRNLNADTSRGMPFHVTCSHLSLFFSFYRNDTPSGHMALQPRLAEHCPASPSAVPVSRIQDGGVSRRTRPPTDSRHAGAAGWKCRQRRSLPAGRNGFCRRRPPDNARLGIASVSLFATWRARSGGRQRGKSVARCMLFYSGFFCYFCIPVVFCFCYPLSVILHSCFFYFCYIFDFSTFVNSVN